MTATPDSLTTTDAAASPDAAADWARWRDARNESLSAPHGWLSLTGLHWLDASPRALPDVPGLWWGDEAGVHVLATADDALLDPGAGTTIAGTRSTVAVEGGSQIAALFGGPDRRRVAVEAIRRTGRPGVRIHDSLAANLGAFTAVPTFAYDPAWVVAARVRWIEPIQVRVGAAQAGLHHDVQVIGEAELVHEGQHLTLQLVGSRESPALLFSDASTGTSAWRLLHLDPAAIGPDGATALDLNRAVNLPYAFSDFGTCPRPVPGNEVPFAVTAGELDPR